MIGQEAGGGISTLTRKRGFWVIVFFCFVLFYVIKPTTFSIPRKRKKKLTPCSQQGFRSSWGWCHWQTKNKRPGWWESGRGKKQGEGKGERQGVSGLTDPGAQRRGPGHRVLPPCSVEGKLWVSSHRVSAVAHALAPGPVSLSPSPKCFSSVSAS